MDFYKVASILESEGIRKKLSARDAVESRNRIRQTARDLMSEAELASLLDSKEPMATFDGLVAKYSGPPENLSGDSLYNRIIEGSMKGRGTIDDLFQIPKS